jgi:hypothetical protein
MLLLRGGHDRRPFSQFPFRQRKPLQFFTETDDRVGTLAHFGYLGLSWLLSPCSAGLCLRYQEGNLDAESGMRTTPHHI